MEILGLIFHAYFRRAVFPVLSITKQTTMVPKAGRKSLPTIQLIPTLKKLRSKLNKTKKNLLPARDTLLLHVEHLHEFKCLIE